MLPLFRLFLLLLGCFAFATTATATDVLFYHPRIANIHYDNELEMNFSARHKWFEYVYLIP